MTSSPSSRFPLSRYFALLSALVLSGVVVGLVSFNGALARKDLISLGEKNNLALTQAFANSAWQPFAPYVAASGGLSGDELRERPETQVLRQTVLDLMHGTDALKVKVYNLEGLTVFSTEAAQMGDNKLSNPGYVSARAGRVATELTHRNTFSAFEQTVEDRDVLASYIPIRPHADGAVEAVFEVYTDVTPLLAQIERTETWVAVGSTGLLALLFLAQFFFIRRAEFTIDSQHAEIEQINDNLRREVDARLNAESALRDHNEGLEAKVEERTRDLEKAKNAAEAANSAKGEFLANMSHELRTPLHAILSFAEFGVSRAGNTDAEKLVGYFEQIRSSGEILLRLVSTLLDTSKLDSGLADLSIEQVDLHTLVSDVVQEFDRLAHDSNLRIDLLSPGEPTVAEVDVLRFGQVVRNLVGNAVKFSPDGGTVQVRVDAPADQPHFQLTVFDNGPGIPEDELDLIFEKFVQSSRTRTGAGGTGLGLAITRELVTAHGGRIQACNSPGGGAIFTVSLPRWRKESLDGAQAA